MKKNVRVISYLLIMLFSVFFLFQNTIKADFAGTGGVNGGNVGQTGGDGAWASSFGFYIKIYSENHTKKGSTKAVNIGSYSNPSISALKGWITHSDSGWSSHPEKLYSYLNIPYGTVSGDYKNLLSLIDVELEIGDYIVIEPYTYIDGNKYTFREISDSTNKYSKCVAYVCSEYECETYKTKSVCASRSSTQCAVYSTTQCAVSECIKWNFKGRCTKTTCLEKACDTYKCTSYKTETTTTCKTFSSTCKTFSSTCAETKKYSYYVWYAKPAVILAGAANVGSDIIVGDKAYSAPSSSCTQSTYGDNKCGYSSNSNIGYGLTVVRYEDIYKNGEVEISIKRADNERLIKTKTATFKIYDSDDREVAEVTTSNGKVEYELSAGNYKVKEISSPSGYVLASDKIVSINITANEVTNVDFLYNTTCKVDLEDLGLHPTPAQLVTLYQKYQNNTELLNFSSPSCDVATCNNEINIGCLSLVNELPSTFNQNNLSCNNEMINVSGNVGFCFNYFELTNNLSTNQFYGKAGQFLIKQKNNKLVIYDKNLNPIEINNRYIATAKNGKVCYVLGRNSYDISSTLKSSNVYFGDVDGDSKFDLLDSDVSTTLNKRTIAGIFTKWEYELTYNYSFSKEIYLKNITGEYSNTKISSKSGLLGILSKFNSSSDYIPFSVSYNGYSHMTNKCMYETTKEIIRYDKTPNGKIELEFRTIDTSNPFVNRNTNTNFCDQDDCSNNNQVVEDAIKNRNNSYNQTGEGAIYKIRLTPDDIKIIRNYNNEPANAYDNYLVKEVTYNGVKEIRNSFLYNLEQGILNGKSLSQKLFNKKYS